MGEDDLATSPAASDGALPGWRRDELESALKAGTITAEDAVVEMERRMAEETDKMGAAIAEIRAELAQGVVTRSIFAQITESPCNLHQATVHFAAMDDKASPLSKGCLLLSSVLMVLGQCAVATAVFVGVNTPSCISSDQCHQQGTYCQCRNTVADRLICSERGMEAGRCKCERQLFVVTRGLFAACHLRKAAAVQTAGTTPPCSRWTTPPPAQQPSGTSLKHSDAAAITSLRSRRRATSRNSAGLLLGRAIRPRM